MTMFPLLLISFISFMFILLLLINRKRPSKFPPGPKGLPLIGNLHQFPTTNLHLYFDKLAKFYGPITSLRLGCVSLVVIQSAEMAKEVLKTQDHNLCSRPPLIGPLKLSYNGLDVTFAPYNAYFREFRKLSKLHLFSSQRVASSAPIRRDEVLRMMDKITSLSLSSNIVNLSDLLLTLTSSIICRIAFGKRYEDEGIERSRFHSLLNEAEAMFVTPFLFDYLPFMGWLDKLSGKFSRLERVFKDMDKFLDEIINDHLHQNKLECDRKDDITDVMLKLMNDPSFGLTLTLNHIKAVLMNIFVAGADTSAIMVVWTMTELIRNPIIMRKSQDELRTLIHDKSFVEEDDIHQLYYLKAVIKETFRLYPAAPLLIVREALQSCTLEGYDILPKTQVFVNVWSIGRDPKIWENPEKFMPERFLGSSIDFRGNDFELIPFGSGRRICPGMLLGIATFELALANLLYSFDWELPHGVSEDDIDDEVIAGIAVHKKNPLCLVAKKVSHTSI